MKLYRTTAKHSFVKDDSVKIKVSKNWMRNVTITGGEFDGGYVIDPAGTVFDSRNREWDDEMETFFYPFASEETVLYINKAIEAINNHNN